MRCVDTIKDQIYTTVEAHLSVCVKEMTIDDELVALIWRRTGEIVQPYFALASTGIDDDAALALKVAELRKRHRLPNGEPKTEPLVKRPGFAADLVEQSIRIEPN